MFLEYFIDYYGAYKRDLKNKKYKYILSELWMGYFEYGIYVGLARSFGKKFICFEHSANFILFESNLMWLYKDASDKFLSVGWQDDDERVIKGGYLSKEMINIHLKI